eukprot:scaffold82023_cov57-Phaeocystis_antarctica.AAC.4
MACGRYEAAAHIAISMLRSSTVVRITKTNETDHVATGDVVELLAHSKWLLAVNAPSRSVTSVVNIVALVIPAWTPPSSSAQPAVSNGDIASSNTVQLAVKATSRKKSSTRKRSKSPKSMRKNISTNGPNSDEISSTRITRNQSRKTAAARSDVALGSLGSLLDTNATSAANEKTSAVASTRLMLSLQ